MYGEAHDATRCCVEGFSCWVASITDARGEALLYHGRYEGIREFDTEAECIAWLEAEARKRGEVFERVRV